MNADAIVELARRVSRETFMARFSNLFLALQGDESADDAARIGFTTKVIEFGSEESHQEEPPGWEIVPVVKAAGNPYPERISVGRARNCDLVMRDPTVSKLHAHFQVRDSGLELVDLESPNGTRVNGDPLRPHEARAVVPGDSIHFGKVATTLVDAGRLYDLLQFG